MSSDQPIARICQTSLLSCGPDLPVAEAARLMHQARCSSIVVLEEGRPVGIWTEADLLAVDFTDPSTLDQPIRRLMSSPVKTIDGALSVADASMRFRDEGVRHFLVTVDGALTGVLTQTDVILRHGVEHFLVLRPVASALTRPLVSVPAGASLRDAAQAMRKGRSDAAAVFDGDKEVGIITERDVLRLVATRAEGVTAGQSASRPLLSVAHDASLLSARNLLQEKGFRHIGVIGPEGALIGLLSFADILATLQHEYVHRLNEALKDRDDALLRSRKDLHTARRIIEVSLDAIMIINADGVIEYANPSFATVTGYDPSEVIGKTPRLLKSGRHDQSFYHDLWQSLLTRGFWQGEIWNRRKNGEVYPEWLTINTIRDEDGRLNHYVAIFNDISERKRSEERIKNLAYFDSLTGLPNRRLFGDRLSMAIANAHRNSHHLAVMFLDLDLFKRINDTLGHNVGDAVLVETATRLSATVREGDTVARLGGDEFTILLPELKEPEDAAKLAARLIAVVKEPFVIEGHELYVTTSIGISIHPEDGATVENMLKNADTAMYRAKDLGRNSYQMYTPAMNARSFERLSMESNLKHAVTRDELVLAYQVKIDMVSGKVSGIEALCRWLHPTLGLVPPSDFIPLAETVGLIGEIGEWVLRAACRQNRAWQDRGLPPIRMAVNVSAQQFRDQDVASVVAAILDETGLDARWLELELTETVLMQRVDEISKILARLRGMGVRIAVDDFGTGYSSLSYLKRMPIDSLKIDRSFVRDLGVDRDDAEIVSTIIAMAHNLKLKAVAEGVETAEQAAWLRAQGCDEIQGFLISRPVSAEDLVSLFDRNLLPDAVS
ncbi:MAG: EAL domain-containing protein [Alphaproteobacteria bacterium]|nr:EAL domain-containing protein [Alphaproteobacteria bacterium]